MYFWRSILTLILAAIAIAINLLQSSVTNKCKMKDLMIWLGVPGEREIAELTASSPKKQSLPKSIVRYTAGNLTQRINKVMRRESRPILNLKTEVSIASSRTDLLAAYQLIYKQYHSYGYMDNTSDAKRVTLWNSLPETYTIVAKEGTDVTGTVSYIIDSTAGLPMDELASDALNKLRRDGRKICEVSGLAMHKADSKSDTLMKIFQFGLKVMTEFCDVTDYVITVNPRHKLFYRKMLCFEQIGDAKAYKKVKNAPGIPMRLNLKRVQELYKERYGHLNGQKNLHDFFFVEKHAELTKQVASDIERREEMLGMNFLHQFYVKECQLLSDPNEYRLFYQQWITLWIQQKQRERKAG